MGKIKIKSVGNFCISRGDCILWIVCWFVVRYLLRLLMFPYCLSYHLHADKNTMGRLHQTHLNRHLANGHLTLSSH